MFQRLLCLRDSINLDLIAVFLWNGNIAEKSFVYFFQQNLFLQISKHSSVQVLKILTVSTLKNSQWSVTLKNKCKQLRHHVSNEIKNRTNLNENILRLKQAKFNTYS